MDSFKVTVKLTDTKKKNPQDGLIEGFLEEGTNRVLQGEGKRFVLNPYSDLFKTKTVDQWDDICYNGMITSDLWPAFLVLGENKSELATVTVTKI
jgi:hypothetical protein